mmetsp:Transcript_12304/g.36135  ORF Transcript_12304/g.36135 Transcript_12304/m.36135 type:complete len:288 (+) Transcript_12304:1727-2590(+)
MGTIWARLGPRAPPSRPRRRRGVPSSRAYRARRRQVRVGGEKRIGRVLGARARSRKKKRRTVVKAKAGEARTGKRSCLRMMSRKPTSKSTERAWQRPPPTAKWPGPWPRQRLRIAPLSSTTATAAAATTPSIALGRRSIISLTATTMLRSRLWRLQRPRRTMPICSCSKATLAKRSWRPRSVSLTTAASCGIPRCSPPVCHPGTPISPPSPQMLPVPLLLPPNLSKAPPRPPRRASTSGHRISSSCASTSGRGGTLPSPTTRSWGCGPSSSVCAKGGSSWRRRRRGA